MTYFIIYINNKTNININLFLNITIMLKKNLTKFYQPSKYFYKITLN